VRATAFLRQRLSSPSFASGRGRDPRIRLPTLPPTERRLVATTAQGACSLELTSPLVITWPRETLVGEANRSLPGKGRLGLFDVGWSRGVLLGCAIWGDALIYCLSNGGMADVVGVYVLGGCPVVDCVGTWKDFFSYTLHQSSKLLTKKQQCHLSTG
jgi:hypothetical protein